MKVFNLRTATLQDAEITYNWANDPIIRQFSFSKDKIEWQNHMEWFQNKINSVKCLYLILEEDTLPVGSIRFDIDKSSGAAISYLIDPSFHGRGYGEFILNNGIEKLLELVPDIYSVSGTVFKENKASKWIFEKSGFHVISSEDSSITYIKKV